MPFDKISRKTSPDPVQEKLRSNKDKFNRETSEFINNLINFKRLMNGYPNKFENQKTKITDPIPADPLTILGVLASDFQEIAQQGKSIVQEQINYSKNRKQKQVKVPNSPSNPTSPSPAQTLTQALSASLEKKYQLVAEASNPFSRFYTRMTTRTRGSSTEAQERRLRMDLLKLAAEAYKDLGKLQVFILSSKDNSIEQAYQVMRDAGQKWDVINRSFIMFGKTFAPTTEIKDDENPNTVKNPPLNSVENIQGTEASRLIILDVRNYLHLFTQQVSNPIVSDLQKMVSLYLSTSKEDRLNLTKDLQAKYTAAISFLNSDLSTAGSSLKDIYKEINKRAEDPLQTTAQAFLKKWLGKARHQWLPKSSSSYRLEIARVADETRVNLDHLMNALEKGLDIGQLSTLFPQIQKQISSLRQLVRSVHNIEKPDKALPFDPEDRGH